MTDIELLSKVLAKHRVTESHKRPYETDVEFAARSLDILFGMLRGGIPINQYTVQHRFDKSRYALEWRSQDLM